jgi:hypothetical protein
MKRLERRTRVARPWDGVRSIECLKRFPQSFERSFNAARSLW